MSARVGRGLFLAGTAIALALPAWAQAPAGSGSEEVVVTASKRSERVREVSGSVSAVTGRQLTDLGAESYADYIQRVPGVVFNNYQPGVSHVVLRGIATNSGNVQGQPTTGYYVNDIPLTEPGWTIVVPDFDAFDVNRVEVLRGPQGSLFGAASMGGLVNTIFNVADPGATDMAFESTLSSTKNADPSYALKGMVNVPLSPDFAIRVTGNYRNDAGFIDNIGTGIEGANEVEVAGARASLVWNVDAGTTLTWLSIFQSTDAADNSYQNTEYGDLIRNTEIPEFSNTEVEIHSLRLDTDLGFATLTAIGSYQEKRQDWRMDFSALRAIYSGDLDLGLTEDDAFYINSGGESEGKSIEVRLASPDSETFEWLVGAMYYDTDKFLYEQLGATGAQAAFNNSSLYTPGAGNVIAPDGEIFNAFYSDVPGEEMALFGEATYHVSPEWKITAGGRLFKTKVETISTQVGFSTYPGAPIVTPSQTEEDGFSPKASITFTPNDDLMIYALVSKGFRFGTPNIPGLSEYEIPSGSGSDELWNYELGARTTWLDGTLVVDATLFYVDWSEIQLRLQTPDFFNYAANGGEAESMGIELAATWQATDELRLATAVTFMEAELTEAMDILYVGTAPAGSQLPGSSKWSISNTVSYDFGGTYDPTLLVTHQYLSKGISDLNSAVPGVTPNEQGDYNVFDARLRATFGETTVSVFAANIFDERGVTRTVAENSGIGQGLVRPRTLGITLGWSY